MKLASEPSRSSLPRSSKQPVRHRFVPRDMVTELYLGVSIHSLPVLMPWIPGLIEGMPLEPQCDHDGLTHQHQQQQDGAHHLSARPPHLPHFSLVAFSWIDDPRHHRLPSKCCIRDSKCALPRMRL